MSPSYYKRRLHACDTPCIGKESQGAGNEGVFRKEGDEVCGKESTKEERGERTKNQPKGRVEERHQAGRE